MKKNYFLILAFILLSKLVFAQFSKPAAGMYLGGGSISGQSPNIASLNTSIFFQTSPWFMEEHSIRIAYHFSKDIENFLPGRREQYYAYNQAFSVKFVLTQYSGDGKFFEEAVGIIYLNDRTFNDRDNWNLGAIFNAQFGFDLRDEKKIGFTLGPNVEYAFTFGNVSATMFSINLQSLYYF